MPSLITTQTGGQLVVKALLTHGTRTVHCVPGESYLPVLDALSEARNQIRLVVCRQEGGGAGLVGSDFVERDAFQEVNYRRIFGQSAK